MQTFRSLFKQKACDSAFKALYDCECNVCPFTVRIFECIDHQCLDMAVLAEQVGVDLPALLELRDADACDPRMVIALCGRLGLAAPQACPKLV